VSGASRISRVCHIAANSNGSHKTVEQLEHRRKDMCVEMLRECYMSAQKLLNNMVESEEFRSCITEGKPGKLAPNSEAEAKEMVKATMRECETLMHSRTAEGPEWYNIDGNLRLAVQDALSIIPLALGKVQLWMEAPMTAYDINCVPMRECQLLRITRAALQLDDAIDRQSQEDVLKSARKLCHLSDLIVVPLGLEKVDDNGETPLYRAATRGGTDDVRILLDAGANVNAQLSFSAASRPREAPEEGANFGSVAAQGSEMVAEIYFSALHGAAKHGRAEMVEMLLKRGADANLCVSGSGRWPTDCSALMLASGTGCNRVVERLLAYKACTEKRDASGLTALMLAARNGHAKVIQVLLSKGADPKAVRKRPDKDKWKCAVCNAETSFYATPDEYNWEKATRCHRRNCGQLKGAKAPASEAKDTSEVKLKDSSKTIATTALDLAQRSHASGVQGAAECVQLLTQHLS